MAVQKWPYNLDVLKTNKQYSIDKIWSSKTYFEFLACIVYKWISDRPYKLIRACNGEPLTHNEGKNQDCQKMATFLTKDAACYVQTCHILK